MGRPGIAYQDVINAATELQGKGKNITIENIRAILGTGSSSTIANLLRQWKAEHSDENKIATRENLPPEFVALMKGLWERLISTAENKVASIELSTQQKITELQQSLQKLTQDNNLAQQKYRDLEQGKQQIANDKLALEQVLTSSQNEIIALQSKHDSLIQQLQERQNRIDELHKLHQQSQNNLEHYREAAREQRLADQQRYEHQLLLHTQTIDQMQQKLLALSNEKIAIEGLLSQKSEEILEVQSTISEANLVRNKLQEKLSAMQQNHIKNSQTLFSLQNQYDLLQTRASEQDVSIIELQKQISTVSQQLLSTTDKLNETTLQNKSLANEKWILAQEKSQLIGQLKQMQELLNGQLKLATA